MTAFMRRRTGRGVVLVAALAAVAGPACDRGEPGAVAPPGEPVDVRVSSPSTAPSVVPVVGTVESSEAAEVATRSSGVVREVRVEVGDRVRAGDTLVLLDAEGVGARVEAATAEVERARARFRRIRALAADSAATPQELDDARAALEGAEAGLREARSQGAYVALRAPFDGVVAARSADPGDLAVPGVPLVAVLRPASLEVTAEVPAALAGPLAPGHVVGAERAGGGAVYELRVVRRAPAVDPATRTVRVELAFRAARAVEGAPPEAAPPAPGSYLRLGLPVPSEPGVWIPRDAVVRRGQLTGVYVLEEGRLRLRWVRTGMEDRGRVEVLAGVTPAERIVREPPGRLRDGTEAGRVSVAPWEGEGG